MTLAEHWEEAQTINEKLKANDRRFRNTVYIHHSEGFILQEAAFVEVHGSYLYFFGEHMTPQVFELDPHCGVKSWAQFELQHPRRKEAR